MRILTVCSNYRVFGAETITLKMLEALKQRGHEQLAVTSPHTDGEFSRRLFGLGIREEVMPFGAVVLKLRYINWTAYTLNRLPILWWRWLQVLRTFQPDVVLWTGSKQAMLLLPLLYKKPSYVIEFTNVVSSRGNRWLYGQLGKRVTGFVAVSDFMRNHLNSIGAPDEKIHVVKSGTFFEREKCAMEQTRASLNQDQHRTFRIGLVGQVAPNKGHDCLVEAVRLLKDRGIKCVANVFGSGDPAYVIQLKAKIAQANLAGIWNWMGYESDKTKIFGSMDVCVVPSCFGDPFPTVAMEAGAYGLPVVASRVGGLPEIVEDGVTGWLVDVNSARQFADKIEWVCQHPNLAAVMGIAGRERVFREFTVEKMVAEFESLFNESLDVASEGALLRGIAP